ncbi:MAG TPA: hypothetical protein VFJ10_17255 [Acidobacteriaceae bacterium]|jgi:hypothetical protein|nr:hypothetical protein [Acidobacteriaceae bacterium]
MQEISSGLLRKGVARCLWDQSQRVPGGSTHTDIQGAALHVFHLDYLSCALTVLSTVLVSRKMWAGLVVAGVNSALLCLIGLKTSQFGFIPANLFCIAVYGVNFRSWFKPQAR